MVAADQAGGRDQCLVPEVRVEIVRHLAFDIRKGFAPLLVAAEVAGRGVKSLLGQLREQDADEGRVGLCGAAHGIADANETRRDPASAEGDLVHQVTLSYIVDPLDDRILAANHAGCAMLGYTREELLGTRVSHIHPGELPQLREFLDSVLRDAHGSTIKLTCRTKDGTFLPTEMSLHTLERGDRVYILGLVQDRSEHRQPEPDH